jgi:hypothetical protein
MPDLTFEILSARTRSYSAVPTLVFELQITNKNAKEQVYAVALKCQLMIEAVKRTYDEETKDRLFELYGPHTRWDETLRTLFWQIINIPVPAFMDKTVIEINVPCSEDFGTAAGKYFYAVRNGDVPLDFLFSGTLFYENEESALQMTMVPWNKQALFNLPAGLWQQMMDEYFPNCRWLQIRKDIYEKLVKRKASEHFPTLQHCLEYFIERTPAEKINQPA